MKIVDKRTLDAENLTKIEREIEILQQLSHPFIVKLYEVIRTERFLYIVTEYVNNGELFGFFFLIKLKSVFSSRYANGQGQANGDRVETSLPADCLSRFSFLGWVIF